MIDYSSSSSSREAFKFDVAIFVAQLATPTPALFVPQHTPADIQQQQQQQGGVTD
jgi:hypothetical protein